MDVKNASVIDDLEICRKALLRAKLPDLLDGSLLSQGVNLALAYYPESSQLKHLDLNLILLRQLATTCNDGNNPPSKEIIQLVQEKIAPAFRPGGHLATITIANLESSFKAQQARAAEVLSAAGRLSTLLPSSSSIASSSSTTTFIVPLFRYTISDGVTRKANVAAISALLEYVPRVSIPPSLLPDLMDDLPSIDGANPRCTLIVNLLIKLHSPKSENGSQSGSTASRQVVLPLLPFFNADQNPPAVLTHLNRYLLPALFKRDLRYVRILLDLLNEQPELFAAWVGIASLGVSLDLIRIQDLPSQELQDALSHADEDVRLRAFELVTGSKEQISSEVLELVKESFRYNDSLPGTGNRSSFSSATLAFFNRLHQLETQTHRQARKNAKKTASDVQDFNVESILKTCSSFRHWFLTVHLDGILERALRYPIFKALLALNLLAVYLTVFGGDSGVQEQVFTAERVELLFACQASEFTEVRVRSGKILESAQVALPGYESLSNVQSQTILRSALESLNHPRRTQAEAGKATLCILFRKVVLSDVDQQQSLDFVSSLIGRLEDSLAAAEMDLVKGIEEKSLHGTLSAIRDIISCLPLDTPEAQNIWSPTLHRLFLLVERIWTVTRPVIYLGPSKPDKDSADQSVAEHEIARAYEVLGAGDEAEEDEEGMDHTGLLSGCWRATRNAGELLATIFAHPLTQSATQNIWNRQEVDQAGSCFLTWMHEIRHRGTFSKIALAFAELVEAVRPISDLRNLCDTWLQHELAIIASDRISTTRRSAALPYSILSIVSGDEALLDVAVEALITLASVTNTSTSNTTKVHAFNVLKIVLLDARQTKFFDRYFEKAVLMALGAFESSDWNVRNVGLILFSTMVHRCLSPARGGQDYFRSRSTLATRQSFSAFHGRYPQILPFITRYLLEAQAQAGSGRGNKHSPLFPILIIIRSLRWSEGSEALQTQLFRAVEPFLTGKEYQVRQVAAQALSSLVSSAEALIRAISLDLKTSAKNLNRLHGELLLLNLLISNVIQWDQVTLESRRVLEDHLIQFLHAQVPATAPSITQALLDAVTSYLHNAKGTETQLVEVLSQRAERYLSSKRLSYVPAEEVGRSSCVSTLFEHNSSEELYLRVLSGGSENDQLLALQHLADRPSLLPKEQVFENIVHLALGGQSGTAVQTLALETMATLSWPKEVFDSYTRKWSNISRRLEVLANDKCVPLKEAALPAFGWVLRSYLEQMTETGEISSIMERFSHLVLEASHEDQSQPSRFSALHALIPLTNQLFSLTHFPIDSKTSIHQSLLRLIQDDDGDIRQGSASIISSAFGHQYGKGAVHARMLSIYWKWIEDGVRVEDNIDWIEELMLDKECTERDLRILQSEGSATESEVLFGVEPPNLFRDPFIDSSFAARTLAKFSDKDGLKERVRVAKDALSKGSSGSAFSPIDDRWAARRNICRRQDILASILE